MKVLGYYMDMINFNEKPIEGTWADPEVLESQPHDLDKEKLVLLRQAEVALGNLHIKKLELENLGVDDEMTNNELARIKSEIVKHEDLIVELGGEKEVNV